jgi:uncharacterized protein
MAADTLAGKTCLITGASSGIGRELARRFAQDRCRLVLVARREGRLNELAEEIHRDHGVEATALAHDLTVASAADELFGDLRERKIAVDILINNAGFATSGPFASSDLSEQLQLLQLNIIALTQLTRLALPRMISQGWGRIMNVASIAAFMPGPMMAAYYASKAYVLSFSEAIANELKGAGVTVTALCPGPTRTEFEQRAKISDTPSFRSAVMDAAVVARIGHDALLKGKSVAFCGLRHRAQMVPVKFMPRSVLAGFARKFNQASPPSATVVGHRMSEQG